jgi:hypothetical protein
MNINITKKMYVLTDDYIANNGETKTATVKLSVDEKNKTFEVTPGDMMSSFSFEVGRAGKPVEHNLWSTVSKLVHMAIQFAIDDLKLNAEPEVEQSEPENVGE